MVARYLEVNPNGSMRDIAGVRNARGNVVGLMPHPEHAVEPLFGPDRDAGGRFRQHGRAAVLHLRAGARALSLTGCRHSWLDAVHAHLLQLSRALPAAAAAYVWAAARVTNRAGARLPHPARGAGESR